MGEWTIKLSDFVYFLTLITVLVGAYKVVTKPYTDLAKSVKANCEAIKVLQEDNAETKKSTTELFKALTAIINHEIDGNNIDGLKKARESLAEYLAGK